MTFFFHVPKEDLIKNGWTSVQLMQNVNEINQYPDGTKFLSIDGQTLTKGQSIFPTEEFHSGKLRFGLEMDFSDPNWESGQKVNRNKE